MQSLDKSSDDFRLRCLDDFPFFIENVLGFDLADFHREQIGYLLEENKHLCIVNPVGHSKTTIFSVAFPIWKLWTEPKVKICVVSSSLDQSKKILDRVKTTIEENEFLHGLIPESNKTDWNKMEFKTSGGGQYFIKPFNPTIRGIHVDYLILDDILRDEEISQDQAKEIFWGPCWTRVQTVGGKIIVVGTPQSADDLFADIEDRAAKGLNWRFVRKPAVLVNSIGEWVEPLWKERFTLDELRQIRDNMGAPSFAREYLCDPVASGSALFPPPMIAETLDDKLGFTYTAKGQVYIGADLAMSSSATGDYTVFIVADLCNGEYVRTNGDEQIKVIDPVIIRKIERYKGLSYQAHQDNAERLYNDFSTTRFLVDESTFGIAFVEDLRARHLNVEGQSFLREARNSLLLNLRRVFESGRLVIPFDQNDSGAYSLVKTLISELGGIEEVKTSGSGIRTFKSNLAHDDTVMALALAVRDVRMAKPMNVSAIYLGSELTDEKKSGGVFNGILG
jgi:hypothetical protein